VESVVTAFIRITIELQAKCNAESVPVFH